MPLMKKAIPEGFAFFLLPISLCFGAQFPPGKPANVFLSEKMQEKSLSKIGNIS
jgi:hypothetical protein